MEKTLQEKKQATLASDLNDFHGSEEIWRHWLGINYTEGVKYIWETAECYWLLDAIASHQPEAMKDEMLQCFQLWRLVVKEDNSAVLTCERDSGDVAIRQDIEYTDFPMEEIRLYVCGKLLLLPSEY